MMTTHPEHVKEAQIACALRFQGWEYVKTHHPQAEDTLKSGFEELIRPVVDQLTLHETQEDNFAAFFGLQRYLFKWGGETLTLYADQHIAFDFLFLHLYRLDPPSAFSDDSYVQQWNREFKDNAEKAAAAVRRSFRRKGRGKRSFMESGGSAGGGSNDPPPGDSD